MESSSTFYLSRPRLVATPGKPPNAVLGRQVQQFSTFRSTPPPAQQKLQRPYHPTKKSIYPTITKCKFLQQACSYTSYVTNGHIFEASKKSKKPENMANVKEYALLCLGNPLLGEPLSQLALISRESWLL